MPDTLISPDELRQQAQGDTLISPDQLRAQAAPSRLISPDELRAAAPKPEPFEPFPYTEANQAQLAKVRDNWKTGQAMAPLSAAYDTTIGAAGNSLVKGVDTALDSVEQSAKQAVDAAGDRQWDKAGAAAVGAAGGMMFGPASAAIEAAPQPVTDAVKGAMGAIDENISKPLSFGSDTARSLLNVAVPSVLGEAAVKGGGKALETLRPKAAEAPVVESGSPRAAADIAAQDETVRLQQGERVGEPRLISPDELRAEMPTLASARERAPVRATEPAEVAKPSETPPAQEIPAEPAPPPAEVSPAPRGIGQGVAPPATKPPAPEAAPEVSSPSPPDTPFNELKNWKRGETGAAGDLPRSGGSPSSIDELRAALDKGVAKVTKPVLDKITAGTGLDKVGKLLTQTGDDKVSPEWVNATRAYKYDVNKATKGDIPDLIDRGRAAFKGVPEDKVHEVADYLDQRGQMAQGRPMPEGLTDAQKAIVDELDKSMNATYRAQEVAAKTLSPEAMAEQPKYLPRVYSEIEQGENAGRQMGQGSKKVYPRSPAANVPYAEVKLPAADASKLLPEGQRADYLKYDSGKETTLVKFKDAAQRDAFMKALKEKYSGPYDAALAKAKSFEEAGDASTAKLWRDKARNPMNLVVKSEDALTPEIEAGLGRVRDPLSLYGKGAAESAARGAKGRLLQSVVDGRDAKGPWSVDPRSAEGMRVMRTENQAVNGGLKFRPVAGEGWHVLDGRAVREDVLARLRGEYGIDPEKLDGVTKAMVGGVNILRGDMREWKPMHAVWNSRLGLRHVNAALAQLRDLGMEPILPSNWGKVIRGIRETAPGTELGKVAAGLGYTDPSYLSSEELGSQRASEPASLRAGRALGSSGITEGLGTRQIGSGMEALGRKMGSGNLMKAGEATRHFGEGFADLYQKGKEAVARKLFFPFEAVKRVALHDMVTNRGMSPLDADAEIRKYTVDPSAVSDATKVLADTVAPYLRYRVGAGENLVNLAKNKPVTAALDLGGSAAAKMGAGYLAAKVGMSLFGNDATEDEKKEIANEHPGFEPLWRDDKGRWVLLDSKYLDRFGDLEARREKLGMPAWQRISQRAMDVTGLGDQPLYDWWTEQHTGVDRFDRPSKGPLASWAREMLPALTPGVGYQYDRIADAAKGVRANRYAGDASLFRTMLSALVGASLETMDPKRDDARLASEARQAESKNKSNIRFDATRGVQVDRQRLIDANKPVVDELNERLVPWARGETR